MTSSSTLNEYAQRIPLFQGLDTNDLRGLLDRSEQLTIPSGKTICHKGQGGDAVFIVLSGCVKIYDDNECIGACRRGDAFGEIAALDHRTHMATAVTADEVTLIAIREAQINAFLRKEHAVRLLMNIIHMLSEQIVNANRRISVLKRRLSNLERQNGHATN
jgi:CRP-like cAMP-binding protein